MVILSGGSIISLLPSSNFLSKPLSAVFAPNYILLSHRRTHQTLLTPPMCINNNDNNKKKVLVSHYNKGSSKISLLSSTEDDDDDDDDINCITTFCSCDFGCPVASCHELLLTVIGYKPEELALWNPSTKELIKTLPRSSVPRPPSVVYEATRMYGFGLDPTKTTTDYKAIRFLRFEYEFEDGTRHKSVIGHYLVELYSLQTDSWKQIAYPHNSHLVPLLCSSPTYINGFNYWPARSGPREEDFVIFSFDFASDSFPSAPIPGPNCYKAVWDECCFLFAEFEGSLAVVVYLVSDKLFELWVWNNDDESWSRKREWTLSIPSWCPLGLFNNHLFYFFDPVGRELLLFDCSKQKVKKNLGVYADDQTWMRLFPFV